jgi:hypothetical protein
MVKFFFRIKYLLQMSFVTYFLISGYIIFTVLSPASIFAIDESDKTNFLVVINQVRGRSCCDSGSISNTERQLANVAKYRIKSSFAIRYDALTDSNLINLIKSYLNRYPDLIRPAAMMEIVPTLADDAGVNYLGTDESWFHAEHAFTLGYLPDDRKKLIDTYINKFVDVFGYYPTISSAWMIDTPSANYLKTEFGIRTHQITREQWGTDSYTLYGGPFHYPYPASKNWLMIPEYQSDDNLLIMRQTVTDPTHNYGDTSSQFTSQPNDYMRSGRSLDYFIELIANAWNQPDGQNGFALVGLENSMSEEYQIEYEKQLTVLRSMLNQEKAISVFADDDKLRRVYTESKISVYHGKYSSPNVWNITTPRYRIRLIEKDKKIHITDLRYYASNLLDPYTSVIAKHEAFWIIPFFVDGSRWHDPKITYKFPYSFLPAKNDIGGSVSQLTPDIIFDDESEFDFVRHENKQVSTLISDDKFVADFYEDRVVFATTDMEYAPIVPADFPIKYDGKELKFVSKLDEEDYYTMSINCDIDCELSFYQDVKKDINKLYVDMYPYLLPEPVDRLISSTYSRIIVHNKFAIVGRNPSRIILEPHDDFNFPILLRNDAVIISDKKSVSHISIGDLKKTQYQYIDFYASEPTIASIDITMGDKSPLFHKKTKIIFAPNCKENIIYCLLHPHQSIWYFMTKLFDWIDKRK